MLKIIQQNKTALKISAMIFISLILTMSLIYPIMSTKVYAAPAVAVAPVAVAGFGELLALLGIATATGVGAYTLNENFPYIRDYLYNAGENLSDWFSCVPDDLYFQDENGNFYIGAEGGKGELIPVTSPSQLLFKASELPVTWSLPTNFKGTLANVRYQVRDGVIANASNVNNYANTASGSHVWFTGYVKGADGEVYVADTSFRIGTAANSFYHINYIDTNEVSHPTNNSWEGINIQKGFPILMGPIQTGNSWLSTGYTTSNGIISSPGLGYSDGYGRTFNMSSTYFFNSSWKGGGFQPFYSEINFPASLNGGQSHSTTFTTNGVFVSTEIPKLTIEAEAEELETVYVSPGDSQPPDDPNNDGGWELLPPSAWEIFTTIADFINKDSTNNTNHGTTLENFINNNYNYNTVDVDINVPDTFGIRFENPLDINLNLSGGVNVDITINDKTELPSISEGDGENFFSASAVDALAALTTQNPIMGVLQGLFSVIDPALQGIFSVAVSLLIVLGLWKLIRG